MTHTPDILTMSASSFDHFLSLLPASRVTRRSHQVTIHADCGDALWFRRDGRWLTAAPWFDRARRGMTEARQLH